MDSSPRFSFRFYCLTLAKMVAEPRHFFSEFPADPGFMKPLCFLIVSSLVFTGAMVVIGLPRMHLYVGGIFFINAVGMVLIASGLGYMVMTLFLGRAVTYKRFFSIYAFSAGTTLLAAWIPFSIWFTEPWKWWLVGTGMSRSCGFKRWQIVMIIGLSLVMMFLFFRAALPRVGQPH
jgi:Yip1 domain